MATYDLEEQEQLDELRTWWRLHGGVVTTGVTLIAVAFIAWSIWKRYDEGLTGDLSVTYMKMVNANQSNDVKQVRELSGKLLSDGSRTTYATLAALDAGRVLNDAGDQKSAIAQITWVAENARDDALKHVASLRLQALDGGPAHDAESTVESNLYSIRLAELQGDADYIGRRFGDAAKKYERAIQALAEESGQFKDSSSFVEPYRRILQSKLDDALRINGVSENK